jgi:hypothetical protein
MERFHQPGNEAFLSSMQKYVDQYSRAASKKEKMRVSKAAYDELTMAGVRFLKKHPIYQYWYVADQKVGRDKIGHFLRQRRQKNLDNDDNTSQSPSNPSPLDSISSAILPPSLSRSIASSDVNPEQNSALHYRFHWGNAEQGIREVTNVDLVGGCPSDNLNSVAPHHSQKIGSVCADHPESTTLLSSMKRSLKADHTSRDHCSHNTKSSLTSLRDNNRIERMIETDRSYARLSAPDNINLPHGLEKSIGSLDTMVVLRDAPNSEPFAERLGHVSHPNITGRPPSFQRDGDLDNVELFDDATLSEYLD